ncbi:Holliday junction ATP-dependent DNA helicase RuvA [Leuconostoc litchii]|uniref:Holliday junction branch migration complex subunit RuvA n=1 Tax=Leuconostoc litchii TaxID=1981069 RepID=A0A6P2CMQ8_9LACO|nr:Holliday junction branch migration protein RuvA [Leuconostoc litchii]TYC47315.1 Holliday junction branch migration protein RuvA [Leuconostoc litchii]GMA69311.1 Holliday junction ATP-dependent DNA helicase RuvA [Leuconostoc litchii]
MYEYINGLITNITPSYIVIASRSGVGYRLYSANPYRFEENVESHVYVQQIVRENDISLYGFIDADEKALFNKLLNVSGIGPKSALAILANGDAAGLIDAVSEDNVSYLMQFPGVGKKTAQQIVLDLKGKLDDLVDTGATPQTKRDSNHSQELEDALEALIALGYTVKDVRAVSKQINREHNTTDGYIRSALKLLVK